MSRLFFTCALASLTSIACGGSSDNSQFTDPDALIDDGASDTGGGGDTSVTDGITDGSPADVMTGPCVAGSTDKEACGKCGSRIRVCNNDQTWSSFSTCTGETGICTPNQSETADCVDGTKKTRTCTASCTWGAFGACEGVVPCTSGASENQACGTCGKRVRVCSGGTWSDWSGCTEEPGCTPTGDELWLATVASPAESSAAVTIERLRLSDDTLIGTMPIRTTASGANQPLTLFGASSLDGHLARSTDGKYVTMGGYAAAPGVVNVSTESAAPRVFARIDAARTIDTTTTATNLASKTLYGVVSVNGSGFWGVGDAVYYIPYGAASATVSPFASGYALAILDATLHVSWTDQADIFTPKSLISKLSPALPTAAGATSTPVFEVAGTFGGTTNTFDGFFGLARSGGAVDHIYAATGPAVEHWTRSGTTWTKTKTVTMNLASGETTAYVTGFVQGANVVFYATAKSTTGSRLIKCTDTGTATPQCTTSRSATGTVRYRGVALSPK